MSGYVGRFAPSPSGPLHAGSLVAALASYLDARSQGGQWLVRIEDVDRTRCSPEWVGPILRTLENFGFRSDGEVVVQSNREALYSVALDRLRDRGRVYACICSRREISGAAEGALAGVDGPLYPGTCRAAGHAESGAALRLRTDGRAIRFCDRVQGEQEQIPDRDVGDFVLRRKDGMIAYQLAVVVDDALQGVTDVVRGADLLDSTPRQILLQQLLGYPIPRYLHVPVAVNELGQKLSKQTLAPELEARHAAAALNAALAFLGQDSFQPQIAMKMAPADILSEATRRWNPGHIPVQRSRPWRVLSG